MHLIVYLEIGRGGMNNSDKDILMFSTKFKELTEDILCNQLREIA